MFIILIFWYYFASLGLVLIDDIFQNAIEIRHNNAIIANGNALLLGFGNTILHQLAIGHAGATLDDEVVACEVIWKIAACCYINLDGLAVARTQHTWDLHAANVFFEWCVAAKLGNEHLWIRREALDGFGAVCINLYIALKPGNNTENEVSSDSFGLCSCTNGKTWESVMISFGDSFKPSSALSNWSGVTE